MNKDVTYIYTYKYLSAIKKEWKMTFVATWMDLEIIMLSEVSWKEKDKYHDITYLWNLKQWSKWTYLQNRDRLKDVENSHMVIKGKVGGDKLGVWD